MSARDKNHKPIPMPNGNVIEFTPEEISQMRKKGSAVVKDGGTITRGAEVTMNKDNKEPGCPSCAKKRAAAERRKYKPKKKTSPPPLDK